MSKPPTVVGLSDIGRARSRNEDSFSLLPHLGVAVVADGMGGHPGGDVASRVAAEAAATVLDAELRNAKRSPQDRSSWLRPAMSKAVLSAHERVRAEGRDRPELMGMGTTLTALIVDVASGSYALGHVGDSRAYLYRDGSLTQLTRDDTWVQERVEAAQLTVEQARRHPFGHLLTQCVGLDDAPVPHILDGALRPGDAFLLCTDGLVGMLEHEQLVEILASGLSSNGQGGESAPLRALVDAANAAGGHDNITAALVRVALG